MIPFAITLAASAIFVLCMFILHVILAAAVVRDAEVQIDKRGVFLLGPAAWGFAVFLTGLLGFVAYWAIHHSTLRPPSDDSTE